MNIERKLLDVDFQVEAIVEPGAGSWVLSEKRADQSVKTEIYRSNSYTLAFRDQQGEDGSVTSLFSLAREGSQGFTLKTIRIHFDIPMVGVYRIWHLDQALTIFPGLPIWPVLFAPPGGFVGYSCASRNIPMVLAMDTSGRNTLAVGMIDQRPETSISAIGPLKKGLIDLPFSFIIERPKGTAITTDRYDDGIFVSRSNSSWARVLSSYSHKCDSNRGFTPRSLSKNALGPMWASNLPFWEDIDEEVIWDQARKAEELGFKTIEIDLGWNTPPGTHTPQYDPEAMGDWEADRSKFPHFEHLVSRLHEIDMSVIVQWLPFHAGKKTRVYETLRDSLIRTEDGLCGFLCPRNPRTLDYVKDSATRIVGTYGLDGMWCDEIDAVPFEKPCIGHHEHSHQTAGEGFDKCMEAAYKTAIGLNPDLILSYRIRHANINNKMHATHQCATDSFFDYDWNRRQHVFLRSYSSRVPVYTYMQCWSPREKVEIVAKFLASLTLSGVPSIAVDLLKSPPDHLTIMKKWLSFYRSNREELYSGTLEPLIPVDPAAAIKIESIEKAFVGYFGVVPGRTQLGRTFPQIYIANCAGKDTSTRILNQKGNFTARILNYALEEIQRSTLQARNDTLDLDLSTPDPCLIILQKQ